MNNADNRAFIESDIFVRDNVILRSRYGDNLKKATMLIQSTNKIRHYVIELASNEKLSVEIYGIDRLRVKRLSQ